jgi:lysyl-tRNA synthetase class 1
MHWANRLLSGVTTPQTINDSKTPSGRVHVGALRGVLIHDAVFRTLHERGIPVRFLFGVDDYDPLDELPSGDAEHFSQYLGAPLCNVPPPPGSDAPDMAEHFIREFFDIFHELGVRAETYRMRDIYRSGRFNEVIDAILRHAAVVREVYKTVSGSTRPDNWFPLQVICERCGRIGTTEVTSYDGKEVVYTCRPALVNWAVGCGHSGKVSPFSGNAKLPWKLEWAAKWKTFPVTIEGAGKDHNTKGGSREVAASCLEKIFGQAPPLNIPYEFFLVGGAKMSSSKGVGASAREIADLLPPEVLRFLIVRPQPHQPVNFSPTEASITKLFNDFDRCHWRAYSDPNVSEDERTTYELSEVRAEGGFYDVNFQLVVALLQMPHIDLTREVEKRKGAPLTAIEIAHLDRRIQSARHWLANYATEEEKLVLQESLPSRAAELTAAQRAFLWRLADELLHTHWNEQVLQAKIFEAARMTPIDQRSAFQAIYRVLFDRDDGPKAGNLLAILDAEFLVERFRQLPYSIYDFWLQTGAPPESIESWLVENASNISDADVHLDLLARGGATPSNELGETFLRGIGAIEFTFRLRDGKVVMKRVLFEQFRGFDLDVGNEIIYFRAYASEYVGQLVAKTGLPLRTDKTFGGREGWLGPVKDA